MSGASTEPIHALVLAGRRTPDEAGVGAQRHKALEPVDGVPMLERVVAALRASGCVASIHVCSDEPAPARRDAAARGARGRRRAAFRAERRVAGRERRGLPRERRRDAGRSSRPPPTTRC